MNSDGVRAAQETVKSLAGSTTATRLRSERAASHCSEVVTFATRLTVMVMKYPSSHDVLLISGQITGASSITCSDLERESLISLEKPFEEAIAHIDDALESIQQQLMMLTGSTASAENILTSTTPIENILTSAASAENILTSAASAENILTSAASTENILTSTTSIENILTSTTSTEKFWTSADSTENILTNTTSTENILISVPSTENILTTVASAENILTTVASTENILNSGGGTEGNDSGTGMYVYGKINYNVLF